MYVRIYNIIYIESAQFQALINYYFFSQPYCSTCTNCDYVEVYDSGSWMEGLWIQSTGQNCSHHQCAHFQINVHFELHNAENYPNKLKIVPTNVRQVFDEWGVLYLTPPPKPQSHGLVFLSEHIIYLRK